jgi:hypothetical protein
MRSRACVGCLITWFAMGALGCGSDDGGGGSPAAGGSGASGGSSGRGGGSGGSAGNSGSSGNGGSSGSAGSGGTTNPNNIHNPLANPASGPPAGNPNGNCSVGLPSEAMPEDVSNPDRVIGNGTAASCTSAAVVSAVAQGGIITFDCGPDPVVIKLTETAKIFNDTGPKIVIDGGGKVVLSGDGKNRILYMNTCDQAQRWTTSHCQDQDHPQLTIQNLTFSDGNAKNVAADPETDSGLRGGGAIFARGGRIKIVNSRFFNNVCDDVGPDVGGAAVRVFSQSQGKPVYVVNSTFGGAANGFGNTCSNGGGVSSIGVSWTIVNSLFSHNHAIGNGANPAQAGTPGGGSGGGIYNDGNTMTLSLCGTLVEQNDVKAHGAAIFFVTNDHSGNIVINDSIIRNNAGGSWYARPGISMHDDTRIEVSNSTLEP